MVYSYLDHPSDVYVRVKNETLEGIFEDAARATFDIMIETSMVEGFITLRADILADDLQQLFYAWIDHLLYIFDAKSFAIHKTEVVISESNSRPSLTAKIYGEAYDPKKHGQKVAVKAMTYSLMRLNRLDDQWEAYFVLDI